MFWELLNLRVGEELAGELDDAIDEVEINQDLIQWMMAGDTRVTEIARMLGMSQMHVAVLLHRTRRQLQKEVRSYLGVTS